MPANQRLDLNPTTATQRISRECSVVRISVKTDGCILPAIER